MEEKKKGYWRWLFVGLVQLIKYMSIDTGRIFTIPIVFAIIGTPIVELYFGGATLFYLVMFVLLILLEFYLIYLDVQKENETKTLYFREI